MVPGVKAFRGYHGVRNFSARESQFNEDRRTKTSGRKSELAGLLVRSFLEREFRRRSSRCTIGRLRTSASSAVICIGLYESLSVPRCPLCGLYALGCMRASAFLGALCG